MTSGNEAKGGYRQGDRTRKQIQIIAVQSGTSITLLRKLRVAQISRLFAMSAILFAHMANRAMCAPPRGIPTQLNEAG